ncbi:MAG: GrdX family protein [Clostridium sp.]
MIEPLYIVTNNPLSKERFEKKFQVIYLEGKAPMDVLKKVRDEIHLGHELLTHPLMSSVKPNETPYRTVCLSIKKGCLHMQSLDIIEGAIHTTEKFLRDFKTPDWSERILQDFQVIDCDLIHHAIE